jgi:hypothetical protein
VQKIFTEFVALYSDVPTLCMLSNFWKRMERDVFEFVRMQTSGKMISKYERKCR